METVDAGDVVSFLRDSLYFSIIYFWLHGSLFLCLFAARGLSLVVTSRGHSSLWLLIAVASLVAEHGL